ncbi:MAG TPA: hypothetical protein VK831_06440 [Candidatus Deferrimicrobiaceae bacterium]|nr:hypothetical protein [Candidatus Deferrimicrobiaceae bacterium]
MAGVLITGLVAGVGTTIAVALAIVLAGLVGLVGVARRPAPGHRAGPTATATHSILGAEPTGGQPGDDVGRLAGTTVAAMNAATTDPSDPESLMPRWRRPSLLEARRTDPTRVAGRTHTPQRFGERRAEGDLRVVRYAVVPVLDRPDEVLGTRLADLGAGDEVEVVNASDTYLEVICPTGERGWIHRTTVSPPSPAYLAPPRAAAERAEPEPDVEDALTALLAARGIQ